MCGILPLFISRTGFAAFDGSTDEIHITQASDEDNILLEQRMWHSRVKLKPV